MTNMRSALASPSALLALASLVAALVTPWSIGIPQAHAVGTFGFQSAVCWLVVLLLLTAIAVRSTAISVACLVASDVVLLAWYGYAMWLVTTPTYSNLYPFVGTDVVGPAWYASGVALLATSAAVVRRIHDSDLPIGKEVWWLAAVPAFGLARLGRTARGFMWTALVVSALLLATLGSPIAPLFQPISGFPDLPSQLPTRAPTWILLAAAALFATLSVVDTIWLSRRRSH